MGVFSGLMSGGGIERLMRAQALANDDWRGAAQINRSLQEQEQAKNAAEAARQNRERVRAALKQQNIPDAEIEVLLQNLEATGKMQADLRFEGNKARQFGAEGGSIATPNGQGGYNNTFTAPSWQNGSLFGAAQGGAAPQLQIQAEKIMPIEAGGGAVGVMPYTGEARPVIAPSMEPGQFGAPAGNTPPASTPSGSPLTPQPSGPPPQAVDYLRTHPEMWQAFEQKYGPGSARAALGVR